MDRPKHHVLLVTDGIGLGEGKHSDWGVRLGLEAAMGVARAVAARPDVQLLAPAREDILPYLAAVFTPKRPIQPVEGELAPEAFGLMLYDAPVERAFPSQEQVYPHKERPKNVVTAFTKRWTVAGPLEEVVDNFPPRLVFVIGGCKNSMKRLGLKNTRNLISKYYVFDELHKYYVDQYSDVEWLKYEFDIGALSLEQLLAKQVDMAKQFVYWQKLRDLKSYESEEEDLYGELEPYYPFDLMAEIAISNELDSKRTHDGEMSM